MKEKRYKSLDDLIPTTDIKFFDRRFSIKTRITALRVRIYLSKLRYLYLFIVPVLLLLLIAVPIYFLFRFLHDGGFEFSKWPSWGLFGQSLWSWMELLVIPAVLAIGGLLFNRSERKAKQDFEEQRAGVDQAIAKDQQREAALQAFFDYLTEQVLPGKLRESQSGSEQRGMARVRTLAVLRQLDGTRKGLLLQFLYQAKLINHDDPIIDLKGADFDHLHIEGSEFQNIDLSGVTLEDADLISMRFHNSSLRNINFSGTNIAFSYFSYCDLSYASFPKSLIESTQFYETDLSGAKFKDYLEESAVVRKSKMINVKYDDNTKWIKDFNSSNIETYSNDDMFGKYSTLSDV